MWTDGWQWTHDDDDDDCGDDNDGGGDDDCVSFECWVHIVDGWMALDTINSVHKLLRGPDRLAFYFSVDFYKFEKVLLQSTAM